MKIEYFIDGFFGYEDRVTLQRTWTDPEDDAGYASVDALHHHLIKNPGDVLYLFDGGVYVTMVYDDEIIGEFFVNVEFENVTIEEEV